MKPADLAVVGGGLSATALACALAARAGPAFRALFFNRGDLGPGTAYAPQSASLLMNGPVRAMSAVPGDDRHLARYLVDEPGDALICRARFGAYLRATGANALAAHAGLRHERVEIVDIERAGEGYRLTDEGGRGYEARNVVLALGNLPPDDRFLPEPVRSHPGYAGDPWTVDITRFDPACEVIVIGSRLTAMDTIALLDERAFRGRVHIVSRHGLLPLVEDTSVRGVDAASLDLDARTPYTLLRSLRRAAARHPGDWRAIVEGLRPITPAIWSDWNVRERKRFLRHLQSMWAIHRYRVPPATHAAYARMKSEGRINLLRGRVCGGKTDARGMTLTIATASGSLDLHADYAINCTGPNADLRSAAHPFVRNVLARGLMRPDPLALGADVSSEYRVLDANGTAQPHLFAIGPLLRGLWYETTAVNEIRRHAAAIASALLEVALDPTGPPPEHVQLPNGIARKVS
ncbi:MAG TPA: FAD/NAD(P)-binding protein [Candidatus Baltobacteraceae bacterium]|nr:FAD/NAD(P)-binding protein [Candidatus Baltobacteraceae bacterium]